MCKIKHSRKNTEQEELEIETTYYEGCLTLEFVTKCNLEDTRYGAV